MSMQSVAVLRSICRYGLAVVFVPFGLFHVVEPDRFLPIMPPVIPDPRLVIIATGIAEILGGLGLLVPITRRGAGLGLAAYVVCVYPANLYHALWHVHVPPLPDSWWYHGPRLAFQPVLVWLSGFAAGVWPRPAASAPRRNQDAPASVSRADREERR